MLQRLRQTVLLLPILALIAGCSTVGNSIATPTVKATSGLQGAVHGGQQPIVGATIQLYAVGTTGDGSAATPLLTPALTTDATGSFDLTGKFSCPTPTTLVYIVATGGNPGLPPPFNNAASTLISALGQCGNPTNITFLNLNEVTTVAAVYALAPFMSSPTGIGSGPADTQALADAFTLAWEFANPSSGTSPGTNVPPGTTIPTAQINTLANLLSACVNSSGGTAGDSSLCGQLFTLTTPGGGTAATDTTTALLHLALNPGLNTQALYNLIPPTAPFQPSLTQQPPDLGVRPTVPSDFTVTPPSLDFGSIYVNGITASQTVTITNNTTNALTISRQLSGSDPGDFSSVYQPGTPCAASFFMMPGDVCQVLVTFHPTATGARSAYLVLQNTSPNPFISIPLSGVGTAPTTTGPITVSPSTLNFTLYNTPQPVTLTNLGNTPLSISGVTFNTTPNPSYVGPYTQTNDCGTTLQPQSICTINVSVHAHGGVNAVMTIDDDAAAGPQTVTLNYTSPGYFPPDSLDFGDESVGSSSPLLLTVPFDSGHLQFGLTGTNASDFSLDNTDCFVVHGQTCTIAVTFTPSALGTRTAAVDITSVGNVLLTGTGVGPGLLYQVTPSLSFITPPGSPETLLLTVRYTGTLDTAIAPPTINGPHASEFITSSSCSGGAQPNRSCSLTVTYSPAVAEAISGTILISDINNSVQKTIPFTAMSSNGYVATSTGELDFGSTLAGTLSAPQSFTATALSNNPITAKIYGAFQITQGATCSVTPCQISVVFAPPANASPGRLTGTLNFSDPLTGTGGLVYLTGTTAVQTTASVSPGSLTFPLRSINTTSIPQTITVTNTGATNVLSFNTVALTDANPGDYVLTNHCTTNVTPGNFCTIDISFAPTVTGTRTASLKILTNSSTSPDIVSLSGTAQ